MPAESEAQRRYMAMQLAKKRAGKREATGMSESQLRDFSKKPVRASKRSKRNSRRR